MYTNPYSICSQEGKWYRANFHTHAGTGKGTCGAYEIEDVISVYREAGYEVLTISNHDFFSDVSEYQEKYDIILFNGIEYSPKQHMLLIDVQGLIKGDHQEVIDETRRQGGFVVLNHPNWIIKEYWPWKLIDSLTGYTGIEIYNSVIFRLNGTGLATDTWDYLLSQGKIVWGFANDDFHRWFDMAKSWNMIYAPEKSAPVVKESILNGSFYASTGLILRNISFDGERLKLTASSKDTYVKDYEYIFIGKDGKVLHENRGEHGSYRFTGDELYVRVQVKSEHGAMLWTQPIYKTEAFRKP